MTASLELGRTLKRKNALTAIACGALPGLIASAFIRMSTRGWLLGILIGLLWSNAFEYFYHRYLLHWPNTSFGKGHLMHHLTVGTPQEPEHVTFGSSPLLVAALFAINGVFALLFDWRWKLGFAPGILVGFSLYMVLVEEIHWRVHLGGKLPGLWWVREYHMAHHDIPSGRYNVFFPVFDFLFGNIRPAAESTHAAAMARSITLAAGQSESNFFTTTQFILWLWLLAMSICARYFWTGRLKA
ncbi:MAG TPA: sterol desaturase family protein [Terriglobales bacterium]|nr:sterol desaturase family protein [Terriglobales bacterium]